MKIVLSRSGMGEVLRSSGTRRAVSEVAESVGDAARADASVQRHGVEVSVFGYTTDRAAAGVSLAHPAGLAIEAKHGTLTRAAGSAGLQVRGGP